jgi:hypothetical protein
MDEIARTSVVVAAKDHVWCELVEEAVILHLKSGIYYGLNSVGAHIWQLIQEPRTIASILESLINTYDVTHECCEGDLIGLMQDLANRELIEVRAGAERPDK